MCLKKKTLFSILGFILLFSLVLPLSSAVLVNDTYFFNVVSNFSVYVNQTVQFDALNLTDSGRISIYNPTIYNKLPSYFFNLNDTFSVVDFYQLRKAKVYNSAGNVFYQSYTGNLNFTIDALSDVIIWNNFPQIVQTRVSVNNSQGDTISAHSDVCGDPLSSFIYTFESGCTGYRGVSCSDSMFSNVYTYNLLAEDYNENNPNWADPDKSCLFYGQKKNDPSDKIIVQAWRVADNGGQFCTIQQEWDWYVYKINNSYVDSNLSSPYFLNDGNYYEFACEDDSDDTNSGFGNKFPNLFTIDFSQPIYMILLILIIILIAVLSYFRQFVYAAVLTIFLAFIFLFSGINLLIVIITILGGFALLFLGKKIF